MEEYDQIDPDYIKGFNEGYVITQHMPDIAEPLAKAYGESARGQGFQQGKEQYQNEQFERRMPSWLKYNPLFSMSSLAPVLKSALEITVLT